MKCEIIAVGTELLLGDVVDTNSSYIGGQLAISGIDSHFQTKVGDNFERINECIKTATERSDFIVMCGGLGPTQDDITRNSVAEVMGVELVRRPELVEKIQAIFQDRKMTDNNLIQADLPEGAEVIPIMGGTAPGFVCDVRGSILYAVPGVPWEMMQMMEWILTDMRRRSELKGIIKSRTLNTWGLAEAELAEMLDEEIVRLDESDATLAFLASGWNGLKVRITVKADSDSKAREILDREEKVIRAKMPDRIIFGIDGESMESVVLDLCRQQELKLGLAESLTGGLISSRLTEIAGSSEVFVGGIVSYAKEVKANVLGADSKNLAVSEATVIDMAKGACEVLGANCSLAVTGVAGPDSLEGVEVGVVWIASAVDGEVQTQMVRFPFDRNQIRQFTVITALNFLRLRLS